MEVNEPMNVTNDSTTPETSESIGSVLKLAREKQQISIRDAAERLRIMPYQIEAIEAEDFSVFKAEFYAKAYIRNYAKLLNVDEQLLVPLFDTHFKAEIVKPEVTKIRPIHVPCKKRYLGVAAVLLVLLLLWFLNRETVNSTAPASIQGSTLPVKEESESSNVEPSDPAVEIDELESSSEIEEASVEPIDEQPVVPVVQAEIKDQLFFTFTDDCWVEVKDVNGEVLFADLKHRNDSLALEGKAPFTVLLGYAPAVTLTFNGELVSINKNTRSQSAKLSVGRS